MIRLSPARRLVLANACQQGRHWWHPTLITSVQICLVCGVKRYCLACHAGHAPANALWFLCPIHQAQPIRPCAPVNPEVQP